ncbi:MAG: TonB-dependent receptor [Bacteroidales bacterium]|nr:TonB-dependent receptor [Bacteroidales bacterium]
MPFNKIIIITAIILFFLPPLYSQEKSDAFLVGHVKDNGDHIPFVTIFIVGTSIGTATDPTGHYKIANVPVGKLVVRAQVIGYKIQEKEIEIHKDETKELNFNLEKDIILTEEVVITASRYSQTRREAPVVVNTISSKIFSSTGSPTLAEACNFVPGLRLENDCQNCGFSQLRMNGLDGPYSQFLIDSRPVLSTLSGVYGLEMLPANMIDRVEVVRGGGSVLYGANAIGGTVNIITKEPISNSYQIGANIGMIGMKEPDANVNFNTTLVSDDYRGGVSMYGMFRKRSPFNANPDERWDANNDDIPDTKDDFSEITKLNTSVFGFNSYFRPSDYSKLKLDFYVINDFRRGGNQFERKPDQTDITEMVEHEIINGGITYNIFSKTQKNKVSAYASGQKVYRDSYYGAEQDPSAYGNTVGLTWVLGAQNTMYFDNAIIAPSTLIGGVEYFHDELQDTKLGYYDPETNSHEPNNQITDQFVNTISLFAQNEWNMGFMKVLLGLRYDNAKVENRAIADNTSDNYDHISPRINLLYNLNDHIQFRLSFAGGFRVPQIFDEDLHIESSGARTVIHVNSPDLKPETSQNITGGIDFDFKIGKIHNELIVEGFYTKLENPFAPEYEFDDSTKIMTVTRVNSDSYAVVAGANIEWVFVPSSSFDFQVGFTPQIAQYDEAQEWGEAPGSISKYILRTPSTYGYLILNWTPIKKFTTSLSGIYTGPMYVAHYPGGFINGKKITEESLVKTPIFFDLGLKLVYNFKIAGDTYLQVNGGCKNIFNSYQNDFDAGIGRDAGYIYGPNQPRTIFLGVKMGNVL